MGLIPLLANPKNVKMGTILIYIRKIFAKFVMFNVKLVTKSLIYVQSVN